MSDDLMVASKFCSRCQRLKSLSEFHRDRSRSDGRHATCKACLCEAVRQWQEKRRAEIGDDAFRAEQRATSQRHRERTGNETGKQYSRARTAAIAKLIELHRGEFKRLLAAERYEQEHDGAA